MCFSAMVQQNAKEIGLKFHARVQLDMYDELFSRRLKGEKLMINKAMEQQFTVSPASAEELAIRDKILSWRKMQIASLEQILFSQKRRLADAQRDLEVKITKKAQNEQRIAASKIEKSKKDLEGLNSDTITSEIEERIFPLHYMSVLCLDHNQEKVVRPMRYLMRPHNQDENFDTKFNGCYNVRLDSLNKVPWWKDSLEKRHGLIVIKRFYENVAVANYAKTFPVPQNHIEKKNMVICFAPGTEHMMYIPVVWDVWQKKGQPDLLSAALITDEPLPEIAAAGHDRTPIFLKQDAVDKWLFAVGANADGALAALQNREKPHYTHRIVEVA